MWVLGHAQSACSATALCFLSVMPMRPDPASWSWMSRSKLAPFLCGQTPQLHRDRVEPTTRHWAYARGRSHPRECETSTVLLRLIGPVPPAYGTRRPAAVHSDWSPRAVIPDARQTACTRAKGEKAPSRTI